MTRYKTTMGADVTMHAIIEADDLDEAQAKAEDLLEQCIGTDNKDVDIQHFPSTFVVVNDDGSVTVN